MTGAVREGERVVGVLATGPDGSDARFDARYVVDASGRDALFARATRSTEKIVDLDQTALFTHFEGVPRPEGKLAGDIDIVILPPEERRETGVARGVMDRSVVQDRVATVEVRARVAQRKGEQPVRGGEAVDEVHDLHGLAGNARELPRPHEDHQRCEAGERGLGPEGGDGARRHEREGQHRRDREQSEVDRHRAAPPGTWSRAASSGSPAPSAAGRIRRRRRGRRPRSGRRPRTARQRRTRRPRSRTRSRISAWSSRAPLATGGR
ncbi:hypothetical protein [Salmonella enterica]|uniref:hypothetical protein n=1 Tax=Salmonella enterica TaxID=28901 RepID=UPI0035BE8704